MPSLKDKYTDPELDRSNKAFEEMVNRPEMKAVDDQGDAVARNIKEAEENSSAPGSFHEGDGKDAARRAEAQDWNNPENRFYQPTKTTSTRIDTWSKRRKLAAFGGGGGAVSAIIIAFFSLLPLKVPGLMQLVMDTTAQRVEQITDKRAKIILGRAILTKFGTNTGIVITGEGAFKTLVASMRTSGFEKRLAAKGLSIDPTPDGVKLSYKGKPLGNGTTFKNEAAIVDALENDRNIDNKLIKAIVKEDISSWRWMKRAKFAKWLRIKYGVPRYGLVNSQKDDPAEKKKDMDSERVKSANARTNSSFREMLGCLMGGSCSKVNGSESPSAKAGEANAAADDVAKAGDTLVADVADNGLKATTETSTKLLLKTFGSKAIPIVGWIDIIATLDHFANETIGENDYFGKIAAYYKGAAYAAVFAEWSGYGSQIQLGTMDPEYIGVLSDELNGSEKAQAIQAVQGNPSAGVPVSLKVDDGKPSSVKQLFDNIKNSPLGFGNKYIGHPVLNAYYETLGSGGFLGWLTGHIGTIFTIIVLHPIQAFIGIVTPDAVGNKVKEVALDTVSALGPYILKSFGFTLDAFDRGASLMNNIFGGGVVSTNEYCKEIGCRKLSSEELTVQNASVAAERADYRQQKGLAYSLFSPDETTSLTSQIAVSMPTSPMGTLSSLSNIVASIPSKLVSIISPKATAATGQNLESLYGVTPYGATQNDLNQPLSDAFLKGEDCPAVADGAYDGCKIDTEVASAMYCEFAPDDPDCSDTDQPTSSSAAVGSMRVGTYNVKVPGQTDSPNDGWLDSSVRMPMIANIVKANGIQVVGFQEVEPSTFQLLSSNMPEYDSYPKNAGSAVGKSWMDPIFWEKDKFTLVDKGEFNRSYRLCPGVELCEKAVWVRLKDNDGGEFYFMSLHMVNRNPYVGPNKSDDGGAEKREADAKNVVQIIKTQFDPGVPVFFVGDLNSSWKPSHDDGALNGDRNRVPYCILTENNVLVNSYDSADGKSGHCPSPNRPYEIDHIYSTPDVSISKAGQIRNEETKVASDHDPIYADVSGQSSTGSINGWAWPVAESGWRSDGQRWLAAHYEGSDAWTNSIKAAADINIGSGSDDCGKEVYSMLDGSIVQNPSKYTMQVLSTINGKRVIITYAHGKNMKLSGSVSAGEKIMLISNNSSYVGMDCHLHLEINYDGRPICPQDVFPLLADKRSIDLSQLPEATYRCAK